MNPVPPPPGPLSFRFHGGARGAFTITAILLILLVVTIPVSIWLFIRTAVGAVEIVGSTLIARGLITRRWDLSKVRRLGVLSVPIYARGLGGVLARRKVGGGNAIHLCSIDERGKKASFIVSMYDRWPDIIDQVSRMTQIPVEKLEPGVFGVKWPELPR